MKQEKIVKGWAVVGDWDKGIFWWYDMENLDQFQIYRTRKQATRAKNEWRKNGYKYARVTRVTMGYTEGR